MAPRHGPGVAFSHFRWDLPTRRLSGSARIHRQRTQGTGLDLLFGPLARAAAIQARSLQLRRQVFGQEVDEHAHRRQQAAAGGEDGMADALRQRPVRQHHFQLAIAHGVGADRFRQHGDAEAVLDHALQQREVEAGHARLQVHAADRAFRAVEFPALAGFVFADAQGHVIGQLVRIFRAASAIQVLRAGDQQFLHLAEAAHHQAAIVIQARAHAQGDVVAFIDDVHAAVADVQLQAHFGVLRQEDRQQLGQLHLRERDRHAGAHQAAWLGAEAVDHLARGLGLGQHGLRVAMHAGADVGHREAARGALQQAYAQVGFQLADTAAQAGFGDAERAFCCGEATMIDHHGEVVEVVEVLHTEVPDIEQYVVFNHLYSKQATT